MRWPSGWLGAVPTLPSGTARGRRPSHWPLAARRSRPRSPTWPLCEIVFCMVSTWDDVKEVVAGPRWPAVGPAARATPGHRMLLDLPRRFGGAARVAAATRHRHARGSGFWQRQGHQGRAPVVRLFRPTIRVRNCAAVSQIDRTGRELRRRWRARPHRQDLPQRLSRRRHPVAGRDHGAGAKGRCAAPRLS